MSLLRRTRAGLGVVALLAMSLACTKTIPVPVTDIVRPSKHLRWYDVHTSTGEIYRMRHYALYGPDMTISEGTVRTDSTDATPIDSVVVIPISEVTVLQRATGEPYYTALAVGAVSLVALYFIVVKNLHFGAR